MSIAVLPMAEEYEWSPATVGLVQSSFFWGYLLTQVLNLKLIPLHPMHWSRELMRILDFLGFG